LQDHSDLDVVGFAEVSKAEGRVAQTTNMVLGGTVSEDTPDEWNIIDQKVSFSTGVPFADP
jgi:hypothetical protein